MDIPDTVKQLIHIPKNGHITDLVAERGLALCGSSHMLAQSYQKFWIPNGRKVHQKILHGMQKKTAILFGLQCHFGCQNSHHIQNASFGEAELSQ